MQREKRLLLVTLTIATTFGIVAGAIDVQALIKLRGHRSFIRSSAPAGVSVSVQTNDLFAAGLAFALVIALSPAAGLLISLLLPYLPLRHLSRIPRALLPSSSKLRGQGLFLLLITLLSIGPLVALDFLVFHGSRGAIIEVDGAQLSTSMLESMGIPDLMYRSQRYIRVMAIVPWLGILFNIIALPFVFYSASHWSEGLATAVSSTPSISSAEVAEIIRASRAIDEKVPPFV